MCEVCDVIATHVDQTCKEFDDRIYNNEYARAYGYGDEDDEHRDIREEPSESQQDTEDGTRSADSDDHVDIVLHDGCRIIDGHEMVDAQHPDEFLCDRGTKSAKEVVEEELLPAPFLLENRSEHKDGEHIKEQVGEVGVHEHIGEWLPPMKTIGCDVM